MVFKLRVEGRAVNWLLRLNNKFSKKSRSVGVSVFMVPGKKLEAFANKHL